MTIDEIRERLVNCKNADDDYDARLYGVKWSSDIDFLLARVERLTEYAEAAEAESSRLRAALEQWAEDFRRDIASDNFVSEDRHEAMRVTAAALRPARQDTKP